MNEHYNYELWVEPSKQMRRLARYKSLKCRDLSQFGLDDISMFEFFVCLFE